jgi:hypothetical protein
LSKISGGIFNAKSVINHSSIAAYSTPDASTSAAQH